MDCGFTNEEGWFRFRAAAIIIEDGCVLMANNELAPYYYSVGGGVHLHETAEEAVKRVYPTFFQDRLKSIPAYPESIVAFEYEK
jgi:hypothetical protein